MKSQYVKPEMVEEFFVSNSYCQQCSDSGEYITYKFKCDATGQYINFLPGNVYQETGSEEGFQKEGSNKDKKLGNYHACSDTHEVTVRKGTSIDDIFPKGYLRPTGLLTGVELGTTYAVRIWTDNGTNIHCTKALNTSEFEITKS